MGGQLRERWEQQETGFGVWVMLSGPPGAEMVASMGFDYVGIDCQHGMIDYTGMRDTLFALSGLPATTIVRVPANDPAWIAKALDAGAEGVIVPMINSAEEASRAVRACRFPPEGERSFGMARGRQPLGRSPEEINRNVICLPMIETRDGLEAADEICAVDGVTGVYIGPSDLALSLGFDPQAERPAEHAEAIERVRAACERAGIVPAVHAMNGAEAKQRSEQGFRMVTVTADAALLAIGALTELAAARAD